MVALSFSQKEPNSSWEIASEALESKGRGE